MEEKVEKKCKKWTIRMTLIEPETSTWDVQWLTPVALKWLETDPGLEDASCIRLEVENDDY